MQYFTLSSLFFSCMSLIQKNRAVSADHRSASGATIGFEGELKFPPLKPGGKKKAAGACQRMRRGGEGRGPVRKWAR
jgi:hypothetical protein